MSIKKICTVFFTLLLFTGCSIQSISDKDIIKNMDVILDKEVKYCNKDAIGYKYYLPNGVSVKNVNDFNQELYSNGSTYYLYADIVSYYYKAKNSYKVDKDAYLSKKITYNKKNGYIEINKSNEGYYVEIMLNYAKMEALVNSDNLVDAVSNMCYILSSIKYNDKIIKTILENEKYDLSENETYNIFKSKKKSTGNFLDYINEYDSYDGDIESLIEKEEVDQDSDK